jgi:hypothetical protein
MRFSTFEDKQLQLNQPFDLKKLFSTILSYRSDPILVFVECKNLFIISGIPKNGLKYTILGCDNVSQILGQILR